MASLEFVEAGAPSEEALFQPDGLALEALGVLNSLESVGMPMTWTETNGSRAVIFILGFSDLHATTTQWIIDVLEGHGNTGGAILSSSSYRFVVGE